MLKKERVCYRKKRCVKGKKGALKEKRVCYRKKRCVKERKGVLKEERTRQGRN